MHRISFDSPFTWDDYVAFASQGRSGRARVRDICVGGDRSVYYILEPDGDTNWIGGVTPDQMTLVPTPPEDE